MHNQQDLEAAIAFRPLFDSIADMLSTANPKWMLDRRDPPWPIGDTRRAPLACRTIRVNTRSRSYEVYVDPERKIRIARENGDDAGTIAITYNGARIAVDPQTVADKIANIIRSDTLP